jgi:glycine dehydrogenase
MPLAREPFSPADSFVRRHLGASGEEASAMLETLGQPSLDALIAAALPPAIRVSQLNLPEPLGELGALGELRALASENRVYRSFIGQGYHDTSVPAVIRRNILENPAWYTAYTPYQAEISQGRLEALLNFQTMVCELTGLEIANASLLDEGTAAAEAMMLCARVKPTPGGVFFVSSACHPQTIDVVRTRAQAQGLIVVVDDHRTAELPAGLVGALVQYPDTHGNIWDYADFFGRVHAAGALAVVAADLLALTLLRPPGEFGADVAIGSSQRFGTPLGFGGPHAAFFATLDAYKRQMPGRLVGQSRDAHGNLALRLALGTREQHIRREKATSNVCTAQALPAIMASMYAVYHGPEGLRRIAARVRGLTVLLASTLRRLGARVNTEPVFDTLAVGNVAALRTHAAAAARRFSLRILDETTVGLSLDETTTLDEVRTLAGLFGDPAVFDLELAAADASAASLPGPHARTSAFLGQPVFNSYHSEHELLRYIRRLEAKDLTLCHTMIPLGSCTMKLNAASAMLPLSWPEWSQIHPFAPPEQTRGYRMLFRDLQSWLAEITGFAAVSLQPNAGSQGEYAGLLAIRAYHAARGQAHRRLCLIPGSAHGTNPASAAMAGLTVVPVACDAGGNIDVADLRAKASLHASELAAIMITYPSTHGVFEPAIQEVCEIVHEHGGQVYMDGANMNALAGLASPGRIGADVCHLNLHKTFGLPHGGGGPGVGPIGVASHLLPYLPGHSVVAPQGGAAAGAVASAPWGSASLLVIAWLYIRMLGADGLRTATERAILGANYVAHRLAPYFPVLYRGTGGLVAHECILDFRAWRAHGIEVEDVAKRLMDYGYHAPTMSFPVPGTLMIEPTESESKREIDRFCDALIAIHAEMSAVAGGTMDAHDNPLKNAPHTAAAVCSDTWSHPYTRQVAAFPDRWTLADKFWPSVGRVDNVYGDRNLVCTCS